MKRLAVVLCGGFLSLFVLTGLVQAADKFGYIHLGRAFNEYTKTKDYEKKVTEKQNNYISERDKKISEFNALRDKFNLLSDKDKEAKKEELQTKAKALKDFVTQKDEELAKDQEEKMKEILKDIETAVKSYAEKEGYTMVFDNRGTIYTAKSVDITDNIIEILNKGK